MEFILEVNERKVGKQSQLTNIRGNKRVPGIVYGFSQKPVSIDMDYRELLNILKTAGTSNIITIKVAGKEIKVIVREYQQDPVSDKLIHVDFMAIDPKKKVTTKIPLKFVGTSKLVREQGAKLNEKTYILNVTCLPGDLPSKVEVDVSVLKEMGQKLVISDLKLSDKVTVMDNPNNPVVNVTMPKKIEIVKEVAETEGAEGEEGAEGAEGEAKEGEAKEATEEKK